MNDGPVAIIYRDFLLPRSETFILSQAEAMRRFCPYYVGLYGVDELKMPRDRVITVNNGGISGKLRSGMFTRMGVEPAIAWRVWRKHPSLIHAHFGVDGSRVMSLAKLLRVPLVVTFHDYDVTTTDEALLKKGSYSWRYIRRRDALKRMAHLFIAVSEHIRQKALERGFPETKIRVHYIGVNTEFFHPRPDIQREPIVLFVGRLVEKKGCADLIRAMTQVQRMYPSLELVVIGDGPLRVELEQQAAVSLGRYRFLGAQPAEVIRDWLNRSRVFCSPSVTDRAGETEGLPIVILEAQAMGTPVVATWHAGIPEAVVHGQTGLLADEHDHTELSRHILRLAEDENLCRKFSAAALDRTERLFDLQTQTSRLEDLYQEVIERRGQQ